MNKSSETVIILGAGLAGLSAGYELVKAGKKVIVLEKNAYVGGLASTFQVGKYRFDTGPHRWFTKISEVDQWVRDLMGKELINVKRLTRIYFNHKYYYYPMQPLNALAGIGIVKATRAILDYFLIRVQIFLKPNPAKTMEDAYVQQFGKTLYKIFFENYSEKLWGRPCRELSGDWVAQRSRGMSIMTIVRDAFFPQKGKVVSLVEEFSYPKLGIGRIAQRLAEEIKKAGGEIILNAEVLSIKYNVLSIKSVIYETGSEKHELTGDEFISSIPLTSLVSSLNPVPPKEVINANKSLSFRNEVFVVLFLKKGKISKDQWIYTQDPSLPFVRFMETDNWSSNLSPKGTTALVFEIASDKDDKIWTMKDEKLVSFITKKYTDEFKAISQDDITGSFVHHQEFEYPIYKVGYEKSLRLVKSYLKKLKNLQIIGRSGMYRYNNMDHTIQSGLWAAGNLLGKNFDLESINIEKEYHEAKKAA